MTMVTACSLAACALLPLTAALHAEETPRASALEEVAQTLNELHAAAARADGEEYFALFDSEAVFLGTDAAERWTRAEFQAYAAPHFAAGKGWSYTPVERHVTFSDDDATAWFDERLSNEKWGETRGSGVLVRRPGGWKLAQYNLSVPIPNALLPDVVKLVALKEPSQPRFEEVEPRKAAELLAARKELAVLDVRTPKEFAAGHIAGALNIDSSAPDFKEWLAALNRGRPTLVHCASGGRSAPAVEVLRALGFREVYHLKDGFKGWKKAGLPVKK